MKKYPSILIAAVAATCVTPVFAQGTVVFNNGTGLVKQWASLSDLTLINVPKGGGHVQLFWAASNTAYTPWSYSLTPAAWYAMNPGWGLGPVVGFTTPTPGKFNGGVLTLQPLQPGFAIDYVIAAWTGNAQSFDDAVAANSQYGVSPKFTTATGNPTTIPPGFPVPLADSFGGLWLTRLTPEPSSFALAALGAATLLALRRRE
jgi:hypothetical protein